MDRRILMKLERGTEVRDGYNGEATMGFEA